MGQHDWDTFQKESHLFINYLIMDGLNSGRTPGFKFISHHNSSDNLAGSILFLIESFIPPSLTYLIMNKLCLANKAKNPRNYIRKMQLKLFCSLRKTILASSIYNTTKKNEERRHDFLYSYLLHFQLINAK